MMKFLIIIALSCSAFGQSFWTPTSASETATYAGSIVIDSWVSQQPNFVETNPIAKPFVRNGWKGQMLGSSLGFAVGLGPSYLLYRTGHTKLSASWLHMFTSAETGNAGLQLHNWITRPR
jgi:hypothetical protein